MENDKRQPIHREDFILIIDDNVDFLKCATRVLTQGGFTNVKTTSTTEEAFREIEVNMPELLIVDIHLQDDQFDGLSFVSELRKQDYSGRIVVLSGDRSSTQFFRAARVGANDFLVKGPNLDLTKDLARILDRENGELTEEYQSVAVQELSYLRSFGLTERELEILAVYAEDFPLQKVLADRIGKSDNQLRKSFSRIQAKLGIYTLSQLGHVLTICAMFERNTASRT